MLPQKITPTADYAIRGHGHKIIRYVQISEWSRVLFGEQIFADYCVVVNEIRNVIEC